MLRIEQRFPDALYEVPEQLSGYTEYHQMLMPALIAPDLWRPGGTSGTVIERLGDVVEGSRRTATLAFESSNLKEAPSNLGWVALKEGCDLTGPQAKWRIGQRSDRHAVHGNGIVWSATRTLKLFPSSQILDESTRLRERYTLTSDTEVEEDTVLALLIGNEELPAEVLKRLVLATATVYAINKAVPKPRLDDNVTDLSPEARKLLENHRKYHAT